MSPIKCKIKHRSKRKQGCKGSRNRHNVMAPEQTAKKTYVYHNAVVSYRSTRRVSTGARATLRTHHAVPIANSGKLSQ